MLDYRLLVQLLHKVGEVAHGLDVLQGVLGNHDAEVVLHLGDELHQVQRVDVQVGAQLTMMSRISSNMLVPPN